MAYSTYTKKSVKKELSTNALATLRGLKLETPDTVMFYELEAAVVLDVIQDENHPIFKEGGKEPKIVETEWPEGWNDSTKPDYSFIGRIKARPIHSQAQTPWSELTWMIPMDSTYKEWPLVNEMVVVVKYLDGWYYHRKINSRNFINHSGDYRWEPKFSGSTPITKLKSPALKNAKNKSNISKECNSIASYLGRYFKANSWIRPLKHFEGDTVLESRFGSSVRFGCYEDNPKFDIGTAEGHGENYDANRGNPMILIRNRQRPLKIPGPDTKDKDNEKIFQHTILEDINKDGSSIHITSGKTISKFKHTLVGPKPKPKKKKKGGLDGLSNLAKSDVGSKGIKDIAEPALDTAKVTGDLAVKAGKTYAETAYGPQIAAAKFAANSDLGGSMTSSFSAALGSDNGQAVGKRFDGMSANRAAKYIDTGPSSDALKANSASGGSSSMGIAASVGTKSPKAEFMADVGRGAFTLNPTFETGIVSSIKSGTKAGKDSLMSSKSGPAISAANSLGIDIPGASAMGMTPSDSPMFKVFKLASFGLRSICAGLKDKKHGSRTEDELGWLLSIGINLELLAILAAIFARLRDLKFNIGSLLGFDLNNLLFDLCDWVNQIEYGSSLADTFKSEATKALNPKELTMFAGNKLMQDGNYDAYARGNPDFDMQYKSLIGDGSALKAAAGMFGQTSLSLNKGSSQVATMSFDPISGLYRETPPTPTAESLDTPVTPNMGTISYDTTNTGGIQYTGTASTTSTTAVTTTSTLTDSDQSSSAPSSTTTPSSPASPTPTPSTELASPSPTPPATTTTDSGQVPQNPDTVKNFHNGEEISKGDLVGTHLENADMNAVSLLHPEDLNSLKDTKQVNDDINEAKKKKDNEFNKKMDAVEKKVEEEQDGGNIMFGKQLPQLDGNQIILNSERIIVSAKTKELAFYGKGKFGMTTDDEMTLNCVKRLVTVTATHTSVVSPTIHLGEYITRRHPVLKGDVATAWLGSLCGWLSGHVHHDPYITTSSPAQQGQLAGLRARLPTLLSTRVFIAG